MLRLPAGCALGWRSSGPSSGRLALPRLHPRGQPVEQLGEPRTVVRGKVVDRGGDGTALARVDLVEDSRPRSERWRSVTRRSPARIPRSTRPRRTIRSMSALAVEAVMPRCSATWPQLAGCSRRSLSTRSWLMVSPRSPHRRNSKASTLASSWTRALSAFSAVPPSAFEGGSSPSTSPTDRTLRANYQSRANQPPAPLPRCPGSRPQNRIRLKA